MIISIKKKFIFLSTRKTASSSLACALNKHLFEDGIQVGAWYDTIKNGGSYNKVAKTILEKKKILLATRYLACSLKNSKLMDVDSFKNDLITSYYRKKHGFDAGAHVSAYIVKREFKDYFTW